MLKSKIKIATLGAGTLDVYLTGNVLSAKRDVRTHDFVEQFPLGEKLELDGVKFDAGGGATNAAVTFTRSGFETIWLGKVGDDLAGREVINVLRSEGVKTNLVAIDLKGTTGYSTILLAPKGERTILVYRGVSEELKIQDFDWRRLSVDWLYITSLAGNLALLSKAVNQAHRLGIKVALDPGSRELAKPARIKKLIPKLTVLKANRDEMTKLFGTDEPKQILKTASRHCRYVVVTDGPNGSWATDGEQIYRAGMYQRVRVVDRTGAGDAFGSGLVAKLAQGDDLPTALTFGSANSTAVVQQVGSKAGILKGNIRLKPMAIAIQPL